MSRYLSALLAVLAIFVAGCSDQPAGKAEVHAKQTEGAYERGPHRGRMLRSGDFAVELTIFEEGVEPEFRAYAFWKDTPVDLAQVKLNVELTRLGGRSNRFEFAMKQDFLQGDGVVQEPHSFDVRVQANYREKNYDWNYQSYEGRTTIAAEAAETAGVKSEPAGPTTIDEMIDLPGRVVLQPQGRAEIRAWYPGRIVEMSKEIGQLVRQGDLLVRIEASDSLRTYQIVSPISGIVSERNANVGDVPTQAIYVVTDPAKVQATFFAFPRDAERLQPGQKAEIRGLGGQSVQSSIQMLLPSADPATQTVTVYAELPNSAGLWRPGMALEGVVTIASNSVPLAVRTRALQRFRDFTVVFAKVDNTYEVRMLKLGRRTPEWTEVLEGIEAGDVYVSDNAFLIRADLEKSGASHDH